MVDSEIKVNKIHEELSKQIDDSAIEAKAHKIARDCTKKGE